MTRSSFCKHTILAYIALILFSCHGKGDNQQGGAYNDFIGKEIKLSGLVKCNIPDGLCLDSLLSVSKNKIVIYVDSSACEDCRLYHALSLRGYELELQRGKDLDDIPFIYIFNTKDIPFVKDKLHQLGFHHYYFIDFDGVFLSNNQIPVDKRFHTFLLQDNKVRVIGNPVVSQKIKHRYNKALSTPK